MADNVINFPGETTADIPPEQVLRSALELPYDVVMVIGADKDDRLICHSSISRLSELLLLLRRAEQLLLNSYDDGVPVTRG